MIEHGVSRQTYASALPVTFDLDSNQSDLARRLVGRRFGRLTVVGVAAMDRGKQTSNGWSRRLRWVVRCGCGNYEHRRTGALGSSKNMGDCCFPCQSANRSSGGG